MALKESGEMYLETIYNLTKTNAEVRSIDIAEQMNYSRASVSRGMSLLKEKRFIDIDGHGFIRLTEAGLSIAEKITERHNVLSSMLIKLGVSEETAVEDACRIEHVISEETFEAIKTHIKKNSD